MRLARRHVPLKTADGWSLHATRLCDPERFDPARRPVVFVPGYGMNSSILGFHPRGTSLVHALVRAGYEVWCCELRAQGGSRRIAKRAPGPSIGRYAHDDVGALLRGVLAGTRTRAVDVHVIGVSLGGSVTFAHLALHPDAPVHSVVGMGAPLRWVEVPRLMRMAFASRRLVGALPIAGTRQLARLALPLARRVPSLLGLYVNAGNVDFGQAHKMLQTVEDPHPRVNREIADWLRARDLSVGGVNVSHALETERRPLLLVAANRDGIVPENTALSARMAWGGNDVTAIRVGNPDTWFAHADLFLSDDAPRAVFDPVVHWLDARE